MQNHVVILNDLLENPETQCVHLDNRGHLIGATTNLKVEHNPDSSDDDKCQDLLYFEEDLQKTFVERLNFLNDTMDLCRRAVNSLRFESPIDEGIELSSEDDYNHNISNASLSSLSSSLKRKSIANYEEFERTPQKRMVNKTEDNVLKTSPTPSDLSVSSKENEEIDKNTGTLDKTQQFVS